MEGDLEFENTIESMAFEENITYISTPRCPNMRGGGAALAVKADKFTLTKCNIHIPIGIEALWGILKPKFPTKACTQIICCTFYSPLG